jgi:hypothetical protein
VKDDLNILHAKIKHVVGISLAEKLWLKVLLCLFIVKEKHY